MQTNPCQSEKAPEYPAEWFQGQPMTAEQTLPVNTHHVVQTSPVRVNGNGLIHECFKQLKAAIEVPTIAYHGDSHGFGRLMLR